MCLDWRSYCVIRRKVRVCAFTPGHLTRGTLTLLNLLIWPEHDNEGETTKTKSIRERRRTRKEKSADVAECHEPNGALSSKTTASRLRYLCVCVSGSSASLALVYVDCINRGCCVTYLRG